MSLTATPSHSFLTTGGQDIGLFPAMSECTVSQAAQFLDMHELTVRQARVLLRMSEQHLNDLLDAGEIVSRFVGNERMILRDSLLSFEQEREQVRAGLNEIVRWDQEMGLYDD